MNKGYYILKSEHCHCFEEIVYLSGSDDDNMYCRTYCDGNIEDDEGNETLHTGWIELDNTASFDTEEWMNLAYNYFEDLPEDLVEAGHDRQVNFFGIVRDYEQI